MGVPRGRRGGGARCPRELTLVREFLFPTGGQAVFTGFIYSLTSNTMGSGGRGAGGGRGGGQLPARAEDDVVARTFFVHGMEAILYTPGRLGSKV